MRRTGDRVEFILAQHHARCSGHVVVGPERDDEDIGLVHAFVGRHALGCRIDGSHRFAQQFYAGLGEVRIGMPDRRLSRPPEQQIELGETEDEAVGLVDEGDLDAVAQRLRERGRQFQSAEAGAEDENAGFHVIGPVDASRDDSAPRAG